MNKVIVISGATATGKTDLSLNLAKKFNCPIINFDSLLFYKELNIGTAKPTPEELNIVKHHLVNVSSISNPLNAASFVKLALPIIDNLHQLQQTPILVGGSGFYLQALLNGMYDSKTTDQEILLKSENLYAKEGIKPFLDILSQNDLESFKLYHENDHYRIRRAVEHFWMTGKPFSKSREEMKHKLKNAPQNNWDIKHYYLNVPKDLHWPIIKKRTLKMIQNGLINEVKEILDQGFSPELKPLQAIGYKEVCDYLNSESKEQNLDDLVEKIYISTRRLAKAQKTWFNKVSDKVLIKYPYPQEEILNEINGFINE